MAFFCFFSLSFSSSFPKEVGENDLEASSRRLGYKLYTRAYTPLLKSLMRPGPRVNVQQLQLRRIDVGGNALSLAKYAVERHPVKLSLNFLGLALLFLVPGFTPSESQEAAYMRLSPSSELIGRERDAFRIMRNAEYTYKQSQGWFWSCDHKCQRYKMEYEDEKREWESQHKALEAQMTRAKSELGVFSKYSFEEAREAFWGSFSRGMQYAKRSTMWDACEFLFYVG